MPGLLIRKLPDHVHALLKVRSEVHRRSMSREALIILESVLCDNAGPPTLEEIDGMRVRGAGHLSQALLDEAREIGRP